MKSINTFAISFISTIAATGVAIAEVSSISAENLVQYGKEQAYWAAEVTCADGGQRIVQRKTDGNQWCGKTIDTFCDSGKETAADKVCGAEYNSAMQLVDASRKAQREATEAQSRAQRAEREQQAQQRRLADQRAASAPQKNQISIEEELIKIEQEKIDLRRQELELQRRAAEIQTLLDKSTAN